MVTTTANGDAPLPASPAGGDHFDGVPVRYVASAFPRRFFGARVRAPLLAGLARADVCHIHGVWNVPEWWASSLARARKVPYVVSPRGMLQPQAVRQGRWRKAVAYRLLDRANLRGAALLHATSEQEAGALRDLALGVPIAVVPNGVDLDAAQQAPRGYRSVWAFRPTRSWCCISVACTGSSDSIWRPTPLPRSNDEPVSAFAARRSRRTGAHPGPHASAVRPHTVRARLGAVGGRTNGRFCATPMSPCCAPIRKASG